MTVRVLNSSVQTLKHNEMKLSELLHKNSWHRCVNVGWDHYILSAYIINIIGKSANLNCICSGFESGRLHAACS